MINVNLKHVMLNPRFSSTEHLEKTNFSLSSYIREEKKSFFNLITYFGMLLLSLTTITGLLLILFEMNK